MTPLLRTSAARPLPVAAATFLVLLVGALGCGSTNSPEVIRPAGSTAVTTSTARPGTTSTARPGTTSTARPGTTSTTARPGTTSTTAPPVEDAERPVPGTYHARKGETVAVGGGATITVLTVDDSRCPADAQCVWAGDLSATVEWRDASGTTPIALTWIVHAQPTPVAGGVYVLTLEGADDEGRLEMLLAAS